MDLHSSLQVVTPSNLSLVDVVSLYELEQDMWAREEGLWEGLQCNDCSRIYSKQEIHNPQNKENYRLTVAEIEIHEGWKISNCSDCGWDMLHCFEREKWIEEIIERYSHQAHLVLMRDWEVITWFMDGYLWSFEKIFKQELSDHYGNIWIDVVRSRVSAALDGVMPEQFFACCSMGTREGIMWMRSIYSLLQCFFSNFPKKFENEVWFSEINRWGTLDRMYKSLGSIEVQMWEYQNEVSCADTYGSWLFLQKNIWRTYRNSFSKDFRTFLKERAI